LRLMEAFFFFPNRVDMARCCESNELTVVNYFFWLLQPLVLASRSFCYQTFVWVAVLRAIHL
jgi:hypothetical protein